MKKSILIPLFLMLAIGVVLSGCATTQSQADKPKPYRMTPQGTVIWEDEFEFLPRLPTGNCSGWRREETSTLDL